MLDGEPLFNPYHVGKCLDMDNVTVRRHLAKMNDKKRVVLKSSLNEHLPELHIPSRGLVFLKKSGVYNLILKSRKPEAEKFQDWITDEVLPQIEETGSYHSQLQLSKSIELETTAKKVEELGIAKPVELSNINKQGARAKLATLITTLSHERQIGTKALYEQLYYRYAEQTGTFIPVEAKNSNKTTKEYMRTHAILAERLYEFALIFFYQGKSVVELFSLDKQTALTSF
jgi:prophage antirepressor-like protein